MLKSLLATASALLAIVVWELSPASVDPVEHLPPVQIQPPKPPVDTRPSADTAVAAILARPLFAPDRKPALTTTVQGMPRLTGIIVTETGAVALFAPDGDGKVMAARLGDHVSEWIVTAISATSVNLQKDGALMALKPQFKPPKGTDPATTPPKPPQPLPAAPKTHRPS